jgi:hypothetical protein
MRFDRDVTHNLFIERNAAGFTAHSHQQSVVEPFAPPKPVTM